LIIRDYGAAEAGAEAAAVAAVVQETVPYLVMSGTILHAQVTKAPARQRYRLIVAEEGGRPVGCARVGLFADSSDPGLGFANLGVRIADRRRGAGSALLAVAEEYLAGLGVTTAYAWAGDEPAAHAFAERHGYRRGRSASFLRLDLGEGGPLPAQPALADGVRLLPASHWAQDPHPLYDVDNESFQDEPSDVAFDTLSYADWRAVTWDRPEFDPELSTAAVVDGQAVAFVIAHSDGAGRYWSAGTGTRRAHRGRGLAKAAKARSLHLARAAGIRAAYTSNDDGNAPMLAVNTSLGYQPCGAEWRYIRDLTARP
jgi:GNAT superfamily N-acetyltransferase